MSKYKYNICEVQTYENLSIYVLYINIWTTVYYGIMLVKECYIPRAVYDVGLHMSKFLHAHCVIEHFACSQCSRTWAQSVCSLRAVMVRINLSREQVDNGCRLK